MNILRPSKKVAINLPPTFKLSTILFRNVSRSVLENYGLEITNIKSFEDYYNEIEKQGALKETISDFGKEFSYLNTAIVITKKSEILNQAGGNIEEENINLDIFVKNIVAEDESAESELSEEDISDYDTSDNDINVNDISDNDTDDNLNEQIDMEQKSKSDINTENLEEEKEEEMLLGGGKILDLDDNFVGGNPKETLEEKLDNEEIKEGNNQNTSLSQKKVGLNITRLEDLYLGPDFEETDIENLAHEDKSIPEEIKQVQIENPSKQDTVNEYESLESLNTDISQLNQSVLNLNNDNFESTVETSPKPEAETKDIKVIKLNIDDNTINKINK